MEDADFIKNLNSCSLEKLTCYTEPNVSNAAPAMRYQFERLGYFCVDSNDSPSGKLVFNRTITLRDTWSKVKRSQKK